MLGTQNPHLFARRGLPPDRGTDEGANQLPYISGYCYTQLTDVEHEQNGIDTYDRWEKFDAEQLKQYFGAAATVEHTQ